MLTDRQFREIDALADLIELGDRLGLDADAVTLAAETLSTSTGLSTFDAVARLSSRFLLLDRAGWRAGDRQIQRLN